METAGAELQPQYTRDLTATPEVVLQRLRAQFAADRGEVRMEFRGAHVQVSVTPESARWWSPWLTMEVLPYDEEHSRVVGRFGSNPAFFTLWMMSLASSLVISFSLAVFAITQYCVGESPVIALCAFAVGTVACFVLAGLPLLGQHYARDQLRQINDRLEACYAEIVSVGESNGTSD